MFKKILTAKGEREREDCCFRCIEAAAAASAIDWVLSSSYLCVSRFQDEPMGGSLLLLVPFVCERDAGAWNWRIGKAPSLFSSFIWLLLHLSVRVEPIWHHRSIERIRRPPYTRKKSLEYFFFLTRKKEKRRSWWWWWWYMVWCSFLSADDRMPPYVDTRRVCMRLHGVNAISTQLTATDCHSIRLHHHVILLPTFTPFSSYFFFPSQIVQS